MWSQLRNLSKLIQPIVHANFLQTSRTISILSSIINRQQSNSWKNQIGARPLLQPSVALVNNERGMKQMGNCKRRCKDCYFVVRYERLYVMCKTHPRHKQMAMKKRVHNTWILTDATQSTKRAW